MAGLLPHTRRLLLDGLDVSVEEFRCRAHVEPLGPEEENASHAIVFVRAGLFERRHRGQALMADPNHVLFFNAGHGYRYAHPVAGGDACTILSVGDGRARELVAHHAPRDAETAPVPFRLGHALSSPRALRLHHELIVRLSAGGGGLDVEDVVAELADEALAGAYRLHDGAGAVRPGTLARRRGRELAEAVKLALNENAAGRAPGLGALARRFGCSPFHLSRVFHREAGLSLRRYAERLRSRRAAERLLAGAGDLTAVALELGYADHSHFTNAFRREWGLPPARFRAASKILQAGARERD